MSHKTCSANSDTANLQHQSTSSSLDPSLPVATRTRGFSSRRNSDTEAPGELVPKCMSSRRRSRTKSNEEVFQNLKVYHQDATMTMQDESNMSDKTDDKTKVFRECAFLMPKPPPSEVALELQRIKELDRQNLLEFEDPPEQLESKAKMLACLIKNSNNLVIYTGAGISTSASIPDYRGPNGLWTQLKRQGSFSMTRTHDLSRAEPTFTHMAIKELCQRRIAKHVVSQNCDGLHLRSGISQRQMSEIHGNMYIEVCPTCEKQYFRQADVTERTSRFRHKTGRQCHTCVEPNNNLIDTIVLFGERSRTSWPMNWERANKAAKRSDLIICMGSSLKTLRRYTCLWPKSITYTTKKTPSTKLVIINLQHTSKDKQATLKINGKCDEVMKLIMQFLNIKVPAYDWMSDPLIKIFVPFRPEERNRLNRNLLFETGTHLRPNDSMDVSPSSSMSSKSDYRNENRCSPSLFVSELADDPTKNGLKMRIRAVNSVESGDDCPNENGQNAQIDSVSLEPDNKIDSHIEYPLPGWLGKSLGRVKTSSYRRKRHGNKGRKRSVSAAIVGETTVELNIETRGESDIDVDNKAQVRQS